MKHLSFWTTASRALHLIRSFTETLSSTHPEGSSYLHQDADEDGAAAAGAAEDKHRRYLTWAFLGGRLIPFFVETFGRWGKEALDFLLAAVDAVAEQNPQVACRGHLGKSRRAECLAHPLVRCSPEGECCLPPPSWT